jgi:hypothetical protein
MLVWLRDKMAAGNKEAVAAEMAKLSAEQLVATAFATGVDPSALEPSDWSSA